MNDPISIGQRFGEFTVSRLVRDRLCGYPADKVFVRCACGFEELRKVAALRAGLAGQCARCKGIETACRREVTDNNGRGIPGTRHGTRVVLGPGSNPWRLSCRCDCGKVEDIPKKMLWSGGSRCGCATFNADVAL